MNNTARLSSWKVPMMCGNCPHHPRAERSAIQVRGACRALPSFCLSGRCRRYAEIVPTIQRDRGGSSRDRPLYGILSVFPLPQVNRKCRKGFTCAGWVGGGGNHLCGSPREREHCPRAGVYLPRPSQVAADRRRPVADYCSGLQTTADCLGPSRTIAGRRGDWRWPGGRRRR